MPSIIDPMVSEAELIQTHDALIIRGLWATYFPERPFTELNAWMGRPLDILTNDELDILGQMLIGYVEHIRNPQFLAASYRQLIESRKIRLARDAGTAKQEQVQ